MLAINFVIYNTDMEHPNKGQSLNYELKIEFTSLSFLDKLIKNITLDSALTLWLALLIISFKCLLKFSFVLTSIPSNFSYTVFFFFFYLGHAA